jgi:threonine dehydrogenase-like Zn-dependent dehydrogenase
MNIPSTMPAIQTRASGELGLTMLPTPQPEPHELLIHTSVATICTSNLIDLTSNPFQIRFPRVLGHEAPGVVAACGREVRGFEPGMRVAAHPVVPCGGCPECLRGFARLCPHMCHLGHDRDGAFAGYLVQRADGARTLPDEVPASAGALLEPVAVCLQAISRAGAVRGRTILIAGDGPFGNIIARLAVRYGARRVIVAGSQPFRLSRIPGVEICSTPPPVDADVAILAVSSAEAVSACLSALHPRGRLVVFSALHSPVSLDLFSVHPRELEIVGSCNDENRLDDAVPCLTDRTLALHEIITHQLPFERWAEAFAFARDGHDRALKVGLTFWEDT